MSKFGLTSGGLLAPRSEVAAENRQLMEELHRTADALAYYNAELRLMDEHLSVVLAKPTTTVEGLKPGYYHLVRMNPGHPAYIKPIEGPNGEWRDLDSSIFDEAAADDLWNDRVQRERRKVREEAEAARKRDQARYSQDRAREIDARIKSINSTSILVTKSI